MYKRQPEDGQIARGQYTAEGNNYYFTAEGIKTAGLVTVGEQKFYYDPIGFEYHRMSAAATAALLIVMGMHLDRHFLFAVGTVACFGAALFVVVVNVILPDGNLIHPAAVSYTHLDVYKRQGQMF